MRKFYLIYRDRENSIIQSGIGQSPIGQLTLNRQKFPFQLSWTHYQVLMTIENPADRSEFPDDCMIDFDMKLIDLFDEMDRMHMKAKDQFAGHMGEIMI